MNLTNWLGAAIAATTVLVAPASAQELPSGTEVLDRAIEASGGRDANLKIKTRKTVMNLSIPAMGMNATITMTQKSPGMMVIEQDIPGFMTGKSGTDGEMFWATDTMSGPRLLEGEERKQLETQADMHAEIEYAKHYKDIECVGIEEVNGQKCHKVTVVAKDSGNTQTRFYSVDTGLLVAMEMTQISAMGEMPVRTELSDYREVDGLMVPFKTSLETGPQAMEITVTSLEQNMPVEDSVFEAPEEVKELGG